MPKLFDIGRCCVILRGRRAGKKAIVVDIIDENYVLITGPPSVTGVKRRRMNIDHLLPLNVKIEISRGASDDDVLNAIKQQKIESFLKEKVRIPEEYL
ncbi:MAG: 50S ribosomal protein L14e [Candidatus Njordarchaeota archaeon]